MNAVFNLNTDDLDESFLTALKTTFAHRDIQISVQEMDATSYLMSSPANHLRLMAALEDVEAGRNVVTPDQAIFR